MALWLLLFCLPSLAAQTDNPPLIVFAAASLTNALQEVGDGFTKARLVRADSVRSALAFVDRGEASLGIVYATDAQIDRKVRVVDVFPDNTHMPIIYPIALTAVAKADAILIYRLRARTGRGRHVQEIRLYASALERKRSVHLRNTIASVPQEFTRKTP
jgi:ABC-type molybdate transport system substrate-binding protein